MVMDMKSETKMVLNDCCVCLLNHLNLENMEIISEEKFARDSDVVIINNKNSL